MRRGLSKQMLGGMALAVGLFASSAQGQIEQAGRKPRVLPPACPPPHFPAMPGSIFGPPSAPGASVPGRETPGDRPGDSATRSDDQRTADTQTPAQAPNLAGETAAAVGAATVAVSPNMFGDLFGGAGSLCVTIPRSARIIPGTPAIIRPFNGTIQLEANSVNTPAFFNAAPLGPNSTGFEITASTFLQNLAFQAGTFSISGGTAFISPINAVAPPAPVAPLVENPLVTTAVQNGVAQPGEQVVFAGGNANFATLNRYSIDQFYNLVTPGTPPVIIPQAPVTICVPSPGGGGMVGRTKVSEDNSPMPRDRVIFNYDYFNNVPLAANGFNVHRIAPGFEKTFLDRNASIEVRLPFASTLDSNVVADGATGTATQFGNIHVTLKGLLYGSSTVNVAGGLGISVPTASDVKLGLIDGTDLLRINNDAVILTPYLAALFTPGERLFVQTWAAVGFDCGGNAVSAAPLVGSPLVGIGRVNDPGLLQLDAQVGYWIVDPARDPGRRLRGLAPFVELHYNTTVSDPDSIALGAFQITDSLGRFDELNLTVGMLAQVGDNLNVSLGAVAPLRGDSDRFFDYQLGLRVNYFFGPTARARERAVYSSSF